MDAQTLNGRLPAVVAQRSTPRPVYAVVGHSQVTADEQARLGLRGPELNRDAHPLRNGCVPRRLGCGGSEQRDLGTSGPLGCLIVGYWTGVRSARWPLTTPSAQAANRAISRGWVNIGQ
jgi:hypothetical protein